MDNCVSIIVPVYNAEKTIRRCIDSALQQSEENIELLLIDDGSTDLSGQICDEYALIDSRITVFHQNNTGVSGARNKGLEYARGEYITFLDADDELFPDAIHVLKDKAKSCDADMVIGRLVHCGKDGVDHVEDIDLIDDLLVGDEFLQLVLEDNPYCYSVYRILYKAPFLAGIKFEVGRIVNER